MITVFEIVQRMADLFRCFPPEKVTLKVRIHCSSMGSPSVRSRYLGSQLSAGSSILHSMQVLSVEDENMRSAVHIRRWIRSV